MVYNSQKYSCFLKASIIESTGSSNASMMSTASLPIMESDEMGSSSGLGSSAISGVLLNANS